MNPNLTTTEAQALEALRPLIPQLIQTNDLLDLRKVTYLFADELLIAAAKSKKGPISWTQNTLNLNKNHFSLANHKNSKKLENHVRK